MTTRCSDELLVFALDAHRRLRHVDDVANGLGCGCRCPECGWQVVANQGQVKAHYFSHVSGASCSGGGVETALHLAVKEVLAREKRMMLPPLVARANATNVQGRVFYAEASLPAKTMSFDNVMLEQWMDGIRPDIVAYVGEKQLLVEVAVTHFVDETKKAALTERGLATVELDLSSEKRVWSWESVSAAVVSNVKGKRWLVNGKQAALADEAQQRASNLAEASNKQIRYREERARATAALKQKREQEQRERDERIEREKLAAKQASQEQARVAAKMARAALRAKIEAQSKSPQQRSVLLQAELARMAKSGPNEHWWQWAASILNLQWDEIPRYLNVEVAGDLEFLIDRRVWQAALFAELVRVGDGATKEPAIIRTDLAVKWCSMFFPRRHSQDLNDLLCLDQAELRPSAVDAVKDYLKALEAFEAIEFVGSRFRLTARCRRKFPAPQEPLVAARLCLQSMEQMGCIRQGRWECYGISPSFLTDPTTARACGTAKTQQIAPLDSARTIPNNTFVWLANYSFWMAELNPWEPWDISAQEYSQPATSPQSSVNPVSDAASAAAAAAYRRRRG